MKTVRLALATAIMGAASLFAATSPAQAADPVYPPITCVISVSSDRLVGGGSFTATATVTNATTSASTSLTYRGVTKTDDDSSVQATFETPVVTKVTITTVRASASANGQTCTASADITLLPKGGVSPGDKGGILPNTGGERLAWLIVGGLLVLVGGGAVVASRRREA